MLRKPATLCSTYLLYTSAAILGLGGPVIWAAQVPPVHINQLDSQGNFLAICSDPDTIGRNSGAVWAMFQVPYCIQHHHSNLLWQWHKHPRSQDWQETPLPTSCSLGKM